MKICIWRGTKQIGGTCIEIESQGKRIVLDIGQPLENQDPNSVEMPSIEGLKTPNDSLLGVVLSHPHIDHYGLSFRVPPSTCFLMGAATQRILEASAIFTPFGGTFENVIYLESNKSIFLGPFKLTPYLMDHSAYDSYAVLIEGDGSRIFYTGDLRGHGRKKSLFSNLIAHPPSGVDILLMEGTTIGRKDNGKGFPSASESDLQKEFERIFRTTTGMPLVWCSGQNIDRIVTVFKAAKRSRRQFIMDMYTAEILLATGNKKLPQAEWEGIRVFLPEFQKRRILRIGKASVANKYRPHRIFPEDLAAVTKNSVMLFRPSMQTDVEKAGCLDGASLVYSMWDGYLKENKTEKFLGWVKDRGIDIHICHTSGHASVLDLQRLRTAFSSAVVCPIHTEFPMTFKELFENVKVLADGEILDIN